VRTDAELREFLRTELAGALRAHAARRREVYASISRWPFVVLAIVGVVAAVATENLWPLASPVVWGVLVYANAHQRVRADGKRSLVGPALRFWNPTLEYDGGCFLDESVFRKSGLFASERWNAYGGEDWVSGRIGETEFKLSELHVRRKRSGKKSDVEIFRGLFVVADFHKSFRGRVYVFPDKAERGLGVFGRAFQKLDGVVGCRLVELESPEFEELFCTYASDPVEARYILSPSLMQRLLDFRKRTAREIRVAFVDECLYLAMPSSHDLFELLPSSLDQAEAAMRRWIADLELATAIVEELGLNVRIWSKGAATSGSGMGAPEMNLGSRS
jgi:hypothetical protein